MKSPAAATAIWRTVSTGLGFAHTTPHTVVRLGRQALSWGHGQVFQPLDLFNPFSPDAKDKSYKPGADMVYAQYLFDGGSDIQAIVVPRRHASGDLTADASSAAVKGFWTTGGVETEVVVASDYGDTVLAFGAAGPFDDALWKFDIVSTRPQNGGTVVSAVANFQDSWTWRTRPVSGFLEWYRNGFGVTDRRPADAPALQAHRAHRTWADFHHWPELPCHRRNCVLDTLATDLPACDRESERPEHPGSGHSAVQPIQQR